MFKKEDKIKRGAGSVIAQTVSRGGPGSSPDQIMWDLWRTKWAGFLRVLRLSLPIIIPPTAPHSSSSGGSKIGQLVAEVPI
jgi:hypothetical protein